MTQTIDFIHTYIEEKHVEFRGNRNEQEFSELSSANGLLLSSANAGILSAGFTGQYFPQQHYGQHEYYQPYVPNQSMPMQPPVFSNPYPIPRPNQQQPSQFQNIMSQFKKANGQFDFNKMMDTTGQVMSAMNQVGSLIKGFTSFFK